MAAFSSRENSVGLKPLPSMFWLRVAGAGNEKTPAEAVTGWSDGE